MAAAPIPRNEVYQPIGPPFGAIEFSPRASVALPAPAAGDATVLTFSVPIGYDGIVLALLNAYTGNTFLDGSGDLVWRVAINQSLNCTRYLRDCGDILVQMGTAKLFHLIPGGARIYSGNTVTYIVNAPNTTGALPAPGTGNIICGLRGFLWPRK